MALILSGGVGKHKSATIANQTNGGSYIFAYDNGNGAVETLYNGTASITASDIADLAYANSTYTLTFKEECECVGGYAEVGATTVTSVSGHKHVGDTITWRYENIMAIAMYT